MSNLAQENLSSPADLIGSRSPDQRPHHILIAGTGRSGTSFLVRYLDALGLDTRMSREGDLWWSESANAGLEDLPLAQNLNNLPYVIKSPWIGEFIEQLLREDRFKIDAVIVPFVICATQRRAVSFWNEETFMRARPGCMRWMKLGTTGVLRPRA
jgi:hypothetical protein